MSGKYYYTILHIPSCEETLYCVVSMSRWEVKKFKTRKEALYDIREQNLYCDPIDGNTVPFIGNEYTESSIANQSNGARKLGSHEFMVRRHEVTNE